MDRSISGVAASLGTALLLIWATPSSAQDDMRTERVQFQRGASSATVEGSISGYESVDYVLGASAGQLMSVSMATDNSSSYFNIIPPGEQDVAIFIGSTSGNQYEGTLPSTGDYKIRVYLMRSAARRNETADYRLEMIITSTGSDAAGSGDAKVDGTRYHATGEIPCKMGGGQPTRSCPFGVEREGGGSGMVTITRPDGRTRAIFFEDGRATGSDASGADGGEFQASREGDLSIVRIGSERYEIPDAVIFGG